MKDKLMRFLSISARFLIRTVAAGIESFSVYLWAIPAARAERGYNAIGGEWALIVFTFLLTFWFIGWFTDFMKLRKEEEVYAAKVPPLPQGAQDAGNHGGF